MRNRCFLITCLLPAFNIFNLLPSSYQITTLLGKGGTGEVYRARDTKLMREVASKRCCYLIQLMEEI